MSDNCTVWVEFTYPLNDPDKFSWEGDIKDERLSDIVCDFLRSQLGAGEDDSPPNELEEYKIKIAVDLSEDRFMVTSNCGNKGLRDGILQDIAARLARKFPET